VALHQCGFVKLRVFLVLPLLIIDACGEAKMKKCIALSGSRSRDVIVTLGRAADSPYKCSAGIWFLELGFTFFLALASSGVLTPLLRLDLDDKKLLR